MQQPLTRASTPVPVSRRRWDSIPLSRQLLLLRTMAVDLILLGGAVALASALLFGHPLPWQAALVGPRVMPLLGYLLATALLVSGLTSGMERPGAPHPSYLRGVIIVGGTFAGATMLLVLTLGYVSRPLLALTMFLWLGGVIAYRLWQRRRPWRVPLMVVAPDGTLLMQTLEAAPHVAILRHCDPNYEEAPELPPTGTTVAVDLRVAFSERVAQFVSSCAIAGYPVRPLSELYEEHTGRIPLVSLGEGWEVVAPLSRTGPYLAGKRLADIVSVVLSVPLWLPLLGLTALLVRISSRGPVIYRQERVGLEGRSFVLLKFRTMRADADRDGPTFTRLDDDRLTRVGRWLRRTHLDELPQMWNVLCGDLSLVGPRPEQFAFVERFERLIPFYADRHLVRPGLTGWAQVRYGYADDQAETIEKLSYDLYYLKHMSPLLDLRILAASVVTIVTGFGAR